jgi:hypothetical protein
MRTRQWVPEFTVVAAPPVWCASMSSSEMDAFTKLRDKACGARTGSRSKKKRLGRSLLRVWVPKISVVCCPRSRERLNKFHRLDCRFSVADSKVSLGRACSMRAARAGGWKVDFVFYDRLAATAPFSLISGRETRPAYVCRIAVPNSRQTTRVFRHSLFRYGQFHESP